MRPRITVAAASTCPAALVTAPSSRTFRRRLITSPTTCSTATRTAPTAPRSSSHDGRCERPTTRGGRGGSPDDVALVIACDGLWDHMTDADAAAVVRTVTRVPQPLGDGWAQTLTGMRRPRCPQPRARRGITVAGPETNVRAGVGTRCARQPDDGAGAHPRRADPCAHSRLARRGRGYLGCLHRRQPRHPVAADVQQSFAGRLQRRQRVHGQRRPCRHFLDASAFMFSFIFFDGYFF